MKETVGVVVVDDHELVRMGLRTLLDRESDINVVGVAPDGESGLTLVGDVQPDVVVIDYNLPGMSGVELCEHITSRWPDIGVVILTTFLDDAVVRNSLEAGAKAYVYKDVEGHDLKRAIRKVANGEAVLDSKVAGRVMQWAGVPSTNASARLSKREIEVMRLVAKGLTNGQIAEELEVSINTVKTCVRRGLKKLGCHSRSQAAAVAAKHGLL